MVSGIPYTSPFNQNVRSLSLCGLWAPNNRFQQLQRFDQACAAILCYKHLTLRALEPNYEVDTPKP